MRREEDVMEIDFFELLLEIRKKIAVILATALVFAVIAGVYSFFIAEPVYESTSKLYIQAQDSSTTTLSELQVGSTLAYDCVEMIQSRSIVQEVIDRMALNMSVKDLQRMLKVTNPEETRIINITVSGTVPQQTAEISGEFAEISSIRISEVMKTNKPQIWEKAAVPENPVKPEKAKNVILGFFTGLILSVMLVIALYLMNDTLKSQDEVERCLDLTVLAVVPLSGDEKKTKKKRFPLPLSKRKNKKNKKKNKKKNRKNRNQKHSAGRRNNHDK